MGFRDDVEHTVMEWQRKVSPDYVTYRLTFPRETVQAQALNLAWALAGVTLRRNQAFVYETYGNDKGWWQYLSVAPKLAPTIEQLFRTNIKGLYIQPEDLPETNWGGGMELALTDMYQPLNLGNPGAAVASMLSHFSPLEPGQALLLQCIFVPARPLPKLPPKRAWPFKQVDEKAYQAKTGAPHTFLATIRIAVKGSNTRAKLEHVGTAFHSLQTNSVRFTDRRVAWVLLQERIARRSVPMNYKTHLTDLELATVLPIPFDNPNVPGMTRAHTRHIFADDSVPREGFVFGDSTWPGVERPVAFDPEGSLQHTHYEGPTRVGKSNTMAYIMLEQMKAGYGVGFIDPTGDGVEDLMCRIPENRWDDVILVDPTDEQFPVGINVFDGTQDPAIKTDELMAIFDGLYRENSTGIYVSNYLRPAIQALASVPGSTLVDLPAFLKDAEFRRRIVEQVDDPEIQRIWREFEELKPSEKESRVAPAIHRVRPLLMRRSIRLMLGQSHNTLDFGRILREGKIPLVSVPKRIGEKTAIFIGSVFVARMWQEAQARPKGEREPWFFLNIDEAPNFMKMPTSFDTVLSEAAKFGLGLGLANQNEGQWPASERAALHANARNKLIYRASIDDAMPLARMLGVTQEDVLGLGKYEAIMRTPDGSPATVRTRELPPPSVTAAAIRARSRRKNGRPRAEVDAELGQRYGGPGRQEPTIG
jgi:hypothetical protein